MYFSRITKSQYYCYNIYTQTIKFARKWNVPIDMHTYNTRTIVKKAHTQTIGNWLHLINATIQLSLEQSMTIIRPTVLAHHRSRVTFQPWSAPNE